MRENKGIEEVRFILHSSNDLQTYEKALNEALRTL